jgi:hypothetical protein
MIYILESSDSIYGSSRTVGVLEHEDENMQEKYAEYMQEIAKELGVEINSHWLNLMNHENWHPHLSLQEYKNLKKEWKKVLKSHTFKKFLVDNGAKAHDSKVVHVKY